MVYIHRSAQSKTSRSCSSRSAVSAALHPFVCPGRGDENKLYMIKSVGNIYRDTPGQKKKLQKWRYRVVSFRARETLRVSKNHLQSNGGDCSSPGMRLGGWRSCDHLLWSTGASWSAMMSHPCRGGEGLLRMCSDPPRRRAASLWQSLTGVFFSLHRRHLFVCKKRRRRKGRTGSGRRIFRYCRKNPDEVKEVRKGQEVREKNNNYEENVTNRSAKLCCGKRLIINQRNREEPGVSTQTQP